MAIRGRRRDGGLAYVTGGFWSLWGAVVEACTAEFGKARDALVKVVWVWEWGGDGFCVVCWWWWLFVLFGVCAVFGSFGLCVSDAIVGCTMMPSLNTH